MNEKETALSLQRLTDLLFYDSDTGEFLYRVYRGRRAHKGQVAGYIRKNGYRFIMIDGWQYLAHRLAWFFVTGFWPLNQIDHVNRDKADNRFANLREATGSDNQANRAAYGASGLKGVSFHKRQHVWRASDGRNGKKITIGSYATAQEAYGAYLVVARQLHGEFANG